MKTLPILLALVGLTLAAAGAASKDQLYRSAQRDLDAKRWTQAIEKFGQVARKRGDDADGALYWKAYAENKDGRAQQALATIWLLSGSYPKSDWLDDAKALEVEIRSSGQHSTPPASATDPHTADAGGSRDDAEELKLYALNGLLASQPERAVPTLQKFLQGTHSQRLKEQALFVLSQSGAPEARTTLLAVARGSSQPELQMKAIEYLGIAGGDENLRTLDAIYRTAARSDVKQSVLGAYLVASQRGRMFAVAKDGKDPLQGQAISLLGAMGAKEELRQLYQADASPKSRLKVLEAMGIAGDAETLIDAARREQDPALRNKAIQGLGINGGAKGAEALRSLYASSSDSAIRRAIVEALFVQANAKALIEIFSTEKDREMRKYIVLYLSLMNSDDAAKFLEKIYSN